MADQNQQAERLNLVTVPGIANFPHLFDTDPKNGKYTLSILFDKKDPDAQKMMRDLQAKCTEAIRPRHRTANPAGTASRTRRSPGTAWTTRIG